MKKILFILSVFLVFSYSCKKLENYNINKKDFTSVTGESLFNNATKALFDQMVNTNVNRNIWRLVMQYWTETTYTDETNFDLVTRTIPDNHFRWMYRDVLRDYQEGYNIIEAAGEIATDPTGTLKNKLACFEIMQIYTWSVLVESFGSIPYTQALDVLTYPTPVYDDAETIIYPDLIARLNQAIADIDVAIPGLSNGDNVYGGNMAAWLRFANSLKLKMGLIMADVNNSTAQTMVESAVASGVFTSNADRASLVYQGSQPNTNPLFVDLVASGRFDFVITNTLVDRMNLLNDPRRASYMTTVGGVYLGGIVGAGNSYPVFSHIADAIQVPEFEGTIMDYAEVQFYLAEAAARNYNVGGTAQSHYEAAIQASFDYWGAGDATAYIAQPAVDFTNVASGATWQEKIGNQSWLAFYNRGFEAWTQQRRLDFPVLALPTDPQSGFPVRFTYPINEQTLNVSNYDAAAAALPGGDVVEQRLFWDIH